jgi:hypothetical protein
MNRRALTFAFLGCLLIPAGFAAGPPAVSLPGPDKSGGMSLNDALAARRSVRDYTAQKLTLAEVGQLLWAAQGVTWPDGKRTAPSAMHRYPLEIAAVAQNVESLTSGVWR